MEEDPKILKVEYLSKRWPDLSPILNFSIGNLTEITCLKGRRPSMEMPTKYQKFEYLSKHRSDFPQIWDWSLGDQSKSKNALNEDDLQ